MEFVFFFCFGHIQMARVGKKFWLSENWNFRKFLNEKILIP